MFNRQTLRIHNKVLGAVALLLLLWFTMPVAMASPTDNDDGWPEWYGLLESRPSGVAGEWVVGGRTFTATSATVVEQEHGTLQIGVCTEVKYRVIASGYQAIKISSEEHHKCNGSDDDDDDDVERYARIESMPSNGLIGDWTIGGIHYTADTNTRFKQEYGKFAVGACVELEHRRDSTLLIELSTERDYKCSGDDDDDISHGELYGIINSFPSGLIGEWVIGGMSFMADNTTQFKQEHGVFDEGVLVEVKFYTDNNGVHHILQIETKGRDDDDEDDDDHSYQNYRGHAYGIVESMPSNGLIGDWIVSGFVYTANAATRFEEDDGTFAVGARVKVKYVLNANNERVALKIETTDDDGGVEQPSHFKMYGFVQQKPTNSFNGQWVIGGVSFIADQNTQFKEQHGLLVIGAYVEVEYIIESGVNYIYKLETHVPPGAGANLHVGQIEEIGGTQAAGVLNATPWKISGQTFLVTSATDLNDLNSALTIGSTALVNSYTDANGAQVATQIRGVTLNQRLFLPSVRR
jgi:hypothetical protein